MSTTSTIDRAAFGPVHRPLAAGRVGVGRLLARLGYALFVLAALPALGAYPIFVMKVLCFALFACAFNLLVGFTGLLSFGHAAFFGAAAYGAGHALKVWGFPPLAGLAFGMLRGSRRRACDSAGWRSGAAASISR